MTWGWGRCCRRSGSRCVPLRRAQRPEVWADWWKERRRSGGVPTRASWGWASCWPANATPSLIPGIRGVPEILPGALDTEWMPVVARRGWVVFHRDRRIRTRPAELEIFRAEGLQGCLKAVWFAGSRDLTPNGAVGAAAAALGSVGA